jgi:ATP-dependent protease ClpP protease subunit
VIQQQQPADTVYVSFSAEVNVKTTESLIAVLAQQANNGVKNVHLLLSTPGGAVMNGLNVYNMMRAMPYKITTHNVGNVDSIGNAIFLAGEERYACPHSTFMFHGVGFDIQNLRFEQKNLQESLDALMRDQERIGSILQERSNLNAADVLELFREARTKDAAYALEKGLIHDIRDVQIPARSPIITLVFQR